MGVVGRAHLSALSFFSSPSVRFDRQKSEVARTSLRSEGDPHQRPPLDLGEIGRTRPPTRRSPGGRFIVLPARASPEMCYRKSLVEPEQGLRGVSVSVTVVGETRSVEARRGGKQKDSLT